LGGHLASENLREDGRLWLPAEEGILAEVLNAQ
jgi:hypothetical protein